MRPSAPPSPGKRELLLEAAALVFARQGFVSTRVADIAEEAGVGKGTVYEYFSSKDELFFAVLQSISEAILSRLRDIAARGADAAETLGEVMRDAARVVSEQRELQPMNLDFCAYSRGTPFELRFRKAVNAMLGDARDLIVGILRDGQRRGELRSEIDPEGVATMLVAAFDGVGMHYWLDPELELEVAVEAFTVALLRGLSPEGRRTACNPVSEQPYDEPEGGHG